MLPVYVWCLLVYTYCLYALPVTCRQCCLDDHTGCYISLYQHSIRATFRQLLNDQPIRKLRPHIMRSMRFVLQNTNFTFSDEHYLQTRGMSIETGFGPRYANIFMARFEEEALDKYHLKPLIWRCFTDDIFIIWTHCKEKLNKLVEYLNIYMKPLSSLVSAVPLKFHSWTPLSELIQTQIRSTDTHSYLFYTSANNKSCVQERPIRTIF